MKNIAKSKAAAAILNIHPSPLNGPFCFLLSSKVLGASTTSSSALSSSTLSSIFISLESVASISFKF